MCCDSRFMTCELSLMSTYNSSNNCGGGHSGRPCKEGDQLLGERVHDRVIKGWKQCGLRGQVAMG